MSDTQTETQPAQAAAIPPGALASDPAFAGFDAETQGAFKNHGWDRLAPAEAAREALKSYREAEKFIGAPKDLLVRLPKDATDAEGIKAFRARIGVPAEATDYDFTNVKFTDGTELEDDFKTAMGAAFHESGVPRDAAPAIVRAMVKFMEGAGVAESTERQAEIAADRDELKKSWGANMEANTFIANQAAAKLGLGQNVLTALAEVSSRTAVANALLKVGQAMGEDRYVSSPHNAAPGIMTREQAEARFQELRGDTDFVARVNKGDSKAIRELDALNQIRAAA